MIITRTPFRISFAGGGSDLPSFYHRHAGCVLSTTINKYMYVSIHPTFGRSTTSIKYSMTENVENVRDLRHPIAKQLLLNYGIGGVEINSIADIPSGTGLSTSSAYTVGLIHALKAYKGKYASQQKIAAEACRLEIEELGEPIGKQDQYGTALGGLKFIRFNTDDTVDVRPVVLKNEVKRRLNGNLLLFYTGLTHSAGEILQQQTRSIASSERKYNAMVRMTELAEEMIDALADNHLHRFGEILAENWELKRSTSSAIANTEIDAYYQRALSAGAVGGKLLGAGGGGFMLFYCEPEHQPRLRSELNGLIELPFEFENGGTKIIYVGDKDWD